MVLPLAWFITSVIHKDMLLLIASFTIFVVLALELFVLIKYKRIKVMIFISLIQVSAGLSLSLFIPVGQLVCVFLLAVAPVLSNQLRGSVRGPIWYFASLVVFLLTYTISSFFELTSHQAFDVNSLVSALATSVIIFILAWYSERRQEALVARLTDMLVFDPTTGLPNKEALCHSIQPDKGYVFAIIKIENFSNLVALFGYEFSDIISQFASQKLRKYEHRYGYTTYQLKYNEYGILIETSVNVTIADASQRLSDVVQSLELESLPWERDRIKLVYRVGGALVSPGDCETPLSRADVALKKAERGHSVICIFENDNTEKESAYIYAIRFTELINNRENHSFKAVFQPVFSSDGKEIVWYEALLRIKQKNGEYSSIYPYLDVAKSTGFYQYLTDFILRKSAEAICEFDVDISINISITDIVRPAFITLVDEVYSLIRHKQGKIIFEILESDELVELDKCIWFIDYISHYGFKIAIDDFGTGYSNYCNLINLPIDIVKIDGSLIRKIKTDDNARLLVEGIIHFCKKSNKKTVAEFVEDIQVFESLRNMDIDFLQGFYLSEPAPISECPCPTILP